MNDTILNSRQNKILSVLKERGNLSRTEIAGAIASGGKTPVSKITLVRDLNLLKKLNLISSKGEARAIKYSVCNTNPLLAYFDTDEYLQKSF